MSASTTTLAPASAGHLLTASLRRALFMLAVAVLLVAAFAVGRATEHTSTTTKAPVVAPISRTAPDTDTPHCFGGRPC